LHLTLLYRSRRKT